MKILVTGGAGFIGSAVVRHIINETPHSVVNVDKLTYAGNLASVAAVSDSSRYRFEEVDICDRAAVEAAFAKHRPNAVMHLAAESYVDRSIIGPDEFIHTNVVGTYVLLEVARSYWSDLQPEEQRAFRFHHVSTDEVFGDLGDRSDSFTESSSYAPSSPYAASKAGADHLVRAWQRTYELPTVITRCSNNYGPYQFPEKLIPMTILNAVDGKRIPVFGDGKQVRDWLYVEDHVRALVNVIANAAPGQAFNIGGRCEMQNLDVVKRICTILDETQDHRPAGIERFADLIEFVPDRPGHDRRYAVDTNAIEHELGWSPQESFDTGLRKTVDWFIANRDWCRHIEKRD